MTKLALEESIVKWISYLNIKDPVMFTLSSRECPLCVQYLIKPTYSCHGCPVYKITDVIRCRRTPYNDAVIALQAWKEDITSDECRAAFLLAVAKEIDFLESCRSVYDPEPEPEEEYFLSMQDICKALGDTDFRPFNKHDWSAFAGCTSPHPLISTENDFTVILDDDVIQIYPPDPTNSKYITLTITRS